MPKPRRRPFAFHKPRTTAGSPRKYARQARAKATVEAIHEAALQVLTEVGYDRLTTTRVAERAGVSVGTLYQYYADKQSLARALVLDYLALIERALRSVLDEGERDLRAQVRHFIRRFLAFKIEHRPRAAALRSVLVLAGAQEDVTRLTHAIIHVFEHRIAAARPRWPAGRAREVATMCTTLVAGSTAEMLDRAPELIAEPWFGESLETAALALL
jgi:AcrR family transcriptional regulator